MDFTNRPINIVDINKLTLENQILKNENDQLRQSIKQQSPESSPPLKNPEISKAEEWIEQGGSIHC
tara:strand:+ start:299 stop:496 length:198 start_codon:yes stop_codon:yes gene_type:complete